MLWTIVFVGSIASIKKKKSRNQNKNTTIIQNRIYLANSYVF